MHRQFSTPIVPRLRVDYTAAAHVPRSDADDPSSSAGVAVGAGGVTSVTSGSAQEGLAVPVGISADGSGHDGGADDDSCRATKLQRMWQDKFVHVDCSHRSTAPDFAEMDRQVVPHAHHPPPGEVNRIDNILSTISIMDDALEIFRAERKRRPAQTQLLFRPTSSRTASCQPNDPVTNIGRHGDQLPIAGTEEMASILQYLTGLKSGGRTESGFSFAAEEELEETNNSSNTALVTPFYPQYNKNDNYSEYDCFNNHVELHDDVHDDDDDLSSSFLLDPTVLSCHSSITEFDDDYGEKHYGIDHRNNDCMDTGSWDELSFLFEPVGGFVELTTENGQNGKNAA